MLNTKSKVLEDGTIVEKTDEGPIIVHNDTTIKPKIPVLEYKHITPFDLNYLDLKTVEEKMRPNKSSDAGFLSENDSLMDVIRKDEAVLEKYRISFSHIATTLDEIMKKGRECDQAATRGMRGSLKFSYKGIPYRMKIIDFMGWQDCPFEQLKTYKNTVKGGKGFSDYRLTNLSNNVEIFFSAMHPHLIEYHHFFEGHTRYRLNPRKCIECLGLTRIDEGNE